MLLTRICFLVRLAILLILSFTIPLLILSLLSGTILVGVLLSSTTSRDSAGALAVCLSTSARKLGYGVPTTAPRDMQTRSNMEGEGAHEDLPQGWL